MWLSNIFNKRRNKIEDSSKRYLSINDKRYDENDILGMIEIYDIFRKYQGYEKIIDLTNGDIVHDKVNSLMSQLIDLGILCKNYDEFDDLYNNYKEFPIDKIGGLDILECMVLITSIQRSDYWFGTGSNIYLGYTKNGLLPKIIYRVISLYESRVN